MKKRLFASAIAVMVLVSCLVPEGGWRAFMCGDTTDASTIRLPLLQLCCTVRSPFRVMNGILETGLPLFPGISTPQKDTNTTDRAAQNVRSLNANPEIRTTTVNGTGGPAAFLSGTPARTFHHCSSPPGGPPAPFGNFLCLFLLVYLVLLSRSNLPWEILNFCGCSLPNLAVRQVGLFNYL